MTTFRAISQTASEGFPAFISRAPWWGGDLQTLRNVLLRPSPRLWQFASTELRFAMNDGTGDVLVGTLHEPTVPNSDHPLVILLHGLGGSAESAYIRVSAFSLLERGFPVLRLNLRGAGHTRPLARELYHAGRTEDLRCVIEQLPSDHVAAGMVMVGFSLGGNLVLKLLGEGPPPGVRAGAAVSAPIDLHMTVLRLMESRNFLYHRWLMRSIKAEALGGPLEPGEAELLRGVRTCWDFDERFVAPRNGWSGAEEYYALNSAKRFLDDIGVPTLIVHALDDPWIPGRMYLDHDWRRNPHLIPLLSARGGHVGFHGVEGGAWHDRCLLGLLERVVSRP